MGCVFSQEHDRDVGRPRKPHQHKQHRLQNEPPKRNVSSFAPVSPRHSAKPETATSGNHHLVSAASLSTSSPEATTGNSSVPATRTSPEDDIHFRRQHFDRNSVLRHSKKRSKKAQSPYNAGAKSPTVSSASSTSHTATSSSNAITTTATSSTTSVTNINNNNGVTHTSSVDPMKISIHVMSKENEEIQQQQQQQHQQSELEKKQEEPRLRKLTAAEIVESEMAKNISKDDTDVTTVKVNTSPDAKHSLSQTSRRHLDLESSSSTPTDHSAMVRALLNDSTASNSYVVNNRHDENVRSPSSPASSSSRSRSTRSRSRSRGPDPLSQSEAIPAQGHEDEDCGRLI